VLGGRTMTYWTVGISAIAFVIGWQVNSWRLNYKIANLQKEYAENIVIAHERTRKLELNLTEKIQKLERKKNAEIANVNARLRVALSELSERTSRATTNKDTADCKGTTGSELSREDAEFLTREAARADRLRSALNICYQQYEEIENGKP
jgi:hypothetical protein